MCSDPHSQKHTLFFLLSFFFFLSFFLLFLPLSFHHFTVSGFSFHNGPSMCFPLLCISPPSLPFLWSPSHHSVNFTLLHPFNMAILSQRSISCWSLIPVETFIHTPPLRHPSTICSVLHSTSPRLPNTPTPLYNPIQPYTFRSSIFILVHTTKQSQPYTHNLHKHLQ